MNAQTNDLPMCVCGKWPKAQRIGRHVPKWWVICVCGEQTEMHASRKRAVAAWNQGERKPRQGGRRNND